MQSFRDILKITTLFGSVQSMNILLNLVRTKLAALILGPSGIGLNSIYNEMRELIHTTTNMGMDVSSVREVSKAYERGDAENTWRSIQLTRSWVFLLALAGALICFFLAEPLSWITFSDFEHTWDFAMLAPSVAFSTLTCGEMAILKGLRKIKALAVISFLDVVTGILTTIPVYYIWGMAGIVPAIVLLTLSLYIIAAGYSYSKYPLRLDFKASHLRNGFPMLMIGVSFVLANIASHGTELAIRTYINNASSLHMVGLYSAGFTIVMTYGGVIFASLDNDYFPRLAGIYTDNQKRKETMNKQIEVLMMLIIPLVSLMMLALPIAVPLLLSDEFSEVIPMAQIASLGLFFRAVYLPAGYMPLAAGDSKSFLGLEILSYLIIFSFVVIGYHYYLLLGAGIALAASNLIDMIITLTFVRWRYKVSINKRILLTFVSSLVFLNIVLALCLLYL